MNNTENCRPELNAEATATMHGEARLGRLGMASRYLMEHVRDGEVIAEVEFKNIVVNSGLNDLLTNYFKGAGYTAAFFVGLIGAGTGTVAETAGASPTVTGTSTNFAAADVGADILIVGAGAAGVDFFGTVASRSSTTSIVLVGTTSVTVSTAGYAIEPVAGDTMSAKNFNETVPYSEGTRPALTLGTVASQSVDNSAAKATFTINASGRVYGAFLATNSTKSGTTGTLYGGGLFSSSRAVLSGDTLNVTLTLTAAST